MDEASCRLSVSSPWVPRDYRQWRYNTGGNRFVVGSLEP